METPVEVLVVETVAILTVDPISVAIMVVLVTVVLILLTVKFSVSRDTMLINVWFARIALMSLQTLHNHFLRVVHWTTPTVLTSTRIQMLLLIWLILCLS